MTKCKAKDIDCPTSASFNLMGLSPEYCKLHKGPGMVNVKNKHYCAFTDGSTKCAKGPVYNIPGSNPKFCILHKDDNMINVTNGSCEVNECDQQPLYNIIGLKNPRFCDNHKENGMINVVQKLCSSDGCNTLPSYNLAGLPAKYCVEHRGDNMVNVISKLCEFDKCLERAYFNLPDISYAKFCSIHKLSNMINVRARKCKFPKCSTQSNFNLPGSASAKFCGIHKTNDMINIYRPTCELCDGYPTYNIPGSFSGKFCSDHKLPDMVNVHDKFCESPGCPVQPAYNLPGLKTGKFCSEHKEDGMVNIKQRICESPGCPCIANFNLEGLPKKFCDTHKLQGMINLNKKKTCESCDKYPIYGFKGSKGRFCRLHKLSNMIIVNQKLCESNGCPRGATYGFLFNKVTHCSHHKSSNMLHKAKLNPICTDCKEPAYYCDDKSIYPIRCENHKLDTDINIIEKPCIICGLSYFIPNNLDKCNSCRDYQDPVIRHAKELRIGDVLKAANISYKSHDAIPDFACSRYRPDYIIENGLFDIILEVDENQHKSYACECEIGRMIQLHQDFGGVPLVFIRYNPDNFRDHLGTLVRGKQINKDREKILVDLIMRLLNKKDELPPLSVIHLFYDGYDYIPQQISLDYFSNSVMNLVDNFIHKDINNQINQPDNNDTPIIHTDDTKLVKKKVNIIRKDTAIHMEEPIKNEEQIKSEEQI